jgi:hypothetical protein
MEHPVSTDSLLLRTVCLFMTAMLVVLLIGAGSSGAADRNLLAGLATVDITPPVGWRMYGSYREQFAGSVHDPLYAKAIVLEQGNERAAFVVCDVCYISRRFSERVRERASDLTGIPASKIIVCATHTHSGPDYDGLLREFRHERDVRDRGSDVHEPIDYFVQLSERSAQAVVEANKRARPATLRVVYAQQHDVAFNRRFTMHDGSVRSSPQSNSAFAKFRWLAKSKRSWFLAAMLPISFLTLRWFIRRWRRPAIVAMVGVALISVAAAIAFWQGARFAIDIPLGMSIGSAAGPVDPDLPFLLLQDTVDGHALGSLTVFAMHTTTFGQQQFSGDYPADLQKHLRGRFGEQFISVFGIGTAGDIGPQDFAKGSPPPDTSRIGGILAATILKNLQKSQSIDHADLSVRSAIVAVPLQDLTDEQIVHAKEIISHIDLGTPDLLVVTDAWKVLNAERFRRRFGASLPMEVNVVRLSNDTAIVALPHEVFVELGLAIKKQSPFKHTMVLTMAHDIDFYIPTKKAFAEGSYEIVASVIKPGGGEMLVDAAVKLLNELK